jgi:hypothetical protein
MASILKFQIRNRPQTEVETDPEGCVVAMKHVDLDVVNDLMRLFRKMDDPEYSKAYAKAKAERRSSSPDGVSCTEKD